VNLSYKTLLISTAVFGLVACSTNFSDLDVFMAKVKAKPADPIEPVPAFEAYQPFNYAATALRHPFEIPKPVDVTLPPPDDTVEPDFDRRKEHLEQFSFETMAFVGSWDQFGQLWGLIDDGQGGVHPIKVGNFMGRNHGQIKSLSETEIKIVEIVPNGNVGWIERPRTILLRESGN
jgi:type IV pilus assembly protein PilP